MEDNVLAVVDAGATAADGHQIFHRGGEEGSAND